jgi:hypothetical protein
LIRTVFYSPISQTRIRFDALPGNIFLFPYKLTDPGTKWTSYDNKEADQDKYLSQKLSFESGTGDAPDDWYVVYADKATNLIEKLLICYRNQRGSRKKNPHAIQYLDYKKIDGIPIATKWVFWEWKEGEGLTNSIGKQALPTLSLLL